MELLNVVLLVCSLSVTNCTLFTSNTKAPDFETCEEILKILDKHPKIRRNVIDIYGSNYATTTEVVGACLTNSELSQFYHEEE